MFGRGHLAFGWGQFVFGRGLARVERLYLQVFAQIGAYRVQPSFYEARESDGGEAFGRCHQAIVVTLSEAKGLNRLEVQLAAG